MERLRRANGTEQRLKVGEETRDRDLILGGEALDRSLSVRVQSLGMTLQQLLQAREVLAREPAVMLRYVVASVPGLQQDGERFHRSDRRPLRPGKVDQFSRDAVEDIRDPGAGAPFTGPPETAQEPKSRLVRVTLLCARCAHLTDGGERRTSRGN